MPRSTGRNTGDSRVRSPVKTSVMYAPKGFTKSVTIATKIAIWSQPLNVIRKCSSEPLRLKLFRADQRVDEIDQQTERHRRGKPIIDDHFGAPQTRSQPTVYRTATTKKA